jgi:hypothetical protein
MNVGQITTYITYGSHMYLAQDTGQWQAPVNMVMNLLRSIKDGKCD